MKSAIYNVQGNAGNIHFNQKRVEIPYLHEEQGEISACSQYFEDLEFGDISNILEEDDLTYNVEKVEVY